MNDTEKLRRLLDAGMMDDADEFRRCVDGALRDARNAALEEAAKEISAGACALQCRHEICDIKHDFATAIRELKETP